MSHSRLQESKDCVTQSNPSPLNPEFKVFLLGQLGVTQHLPHPGHRETLTVKPRATLTDFSPAHGTDLQALPRASQHRSHSSPQRSTARAIQSKLVYQVEATGPHHKYASSRT